MKLYLTIITLLLAFTSGVHASPSFLTRHQDVPDMPPPTVLNGKWSFLLAADEKEADTYRWFFEEGYDMSGWDTIPVPSNWNMEGFEEPHYVNGTASEGFYSTVFSAPPEGDVRRRVLLRFGGSWMSTEAWLNGQRLGRHESGFTGFSFDISDEIRWGEENRLAVRVRQQVQPNLFKFDANDDWGLAGIYRDVWIEYTPRIHVMANVKVETDFDEFYEDADLTARVFIQRWYEGSPFFEYSEPLHLQMTLRTLEGKIVQQETETVRIRGWHQGNDFTLAMHVKDPLQWSAESPNLYDLEITLETEGELVDRWVDRIGFREISTEGGIFRVNGRAVKLRGVARHDQHPDVGRATRHEHWIEDIALMKAANINAVRTAHYPPHEGFIRLCDEAGLYVINEIPLGFGGDRLWEPSFVEGMLLRIYETMDRDMNRPSVVVWSFGNEDPFTALQLQGLKVIKGLDETRPVLMPYRAEFELPEEVDIYAPHYWSAEEYEALAASADRPVITTEYTHALGTRDFGELERRWKALTRHPSGAGGMIWLWADQGLRRPIDGRKVLDPMEDKDSYTRTGSELVGDKIAGENAVYDSHGNYGSDGIVYADREPQRDYWETRAVYAEVEVLDEQVELAPYQDVIPVEVRNGFDFTNLSAITFRWKIFRGEEVVDSGSTQLEAGPHETTRLLLPARKVDPGSREAQYAHIHIERPDGSEMTRASVILGKRLSPGISADLHNGESPNVTKKENSVTITSGDVEYRFENGQISTVRIAGDELVEYADIVIWRRATYSERNRLDKLDVPHDWKTYMQGLEPELLDDRLDELPDNTVRYMADVQYRADDENQLRVQYTYRIEANGSLKVDFSIRPTLDLDWVPEIGILLKIVDEPLNVSWQGEGIGESLPGRDAATIFGVWDAPVFSGEARGTKSDVDWMRIYDERNWGFYATGITAFRLDGELGEGSTLRLLSQVAVPWTKNGPGERPEGVLQITDETVFSGHATLIPVTGSEAEMEEMAGVRPHPAILGSAFINADAPYPSCHASTLEETSEGTLVAAWFGGTRERHPDVGIWFARFEEGTWQPAREVATGEWEDGERYPTWNPVLFQPSEGPLHLFYKVGPSPGSWWGMVMTSEDGGRTWNEPQALPEGILGPIKNKPVELADGTWLSGSSTEGDGWRLHFERSTDQGRTWTKSDPVDQNGLDSIQPGILVHGEGLLQTLNRTKQGVLSTTWSHDGGLTWTPTTDSGLPNPGSGTDAVTLDSGVHFLVYNHSSPPPERPWKGVRYPLNIARSTDGIHWDNVLTVESLPRSAGYAYPCIIQTRDGLVHIAYTFDRDVIKHVILDPSKL